MVFQILGKIEMTQNKNRVFGHFETVPHFYIFIFYFFAKVLFLIVRTYTEQISLENSGEKVVFLGGSMEPPLGTKK